MIRDTRNAEVDEDDMEEDDRVDIAWCATSCWIAAVGFCFWLVVAVLNLAWCCFSLCYLSVLGDKTVRCVELLVCPRQPFSSLCVGVSVGPCLMGMWYSSVSLSADNEIRSYDRLEKKSRNYKPTCTGYSCSLARLDRADEQMTLQLVVLINF
jgi:hypothetical protein